MMDFVYLYSSNAFAVSVSCSITTIFLFSLNFLQENLSSFTCLLLPHISYQNFPGVVPSGLHQVNVDPGYLQGLLNGNIYLIQTVLIPMHMSRDILSSCYFYYGSVVAWSTELKDTLSGPWIGAIIIMSPNSQSKASVYLSNILYAVLFI